MENNTTHINRNTLDQMFDRLYEPVEYCGLFELRTNRMDVSTIETGINQKGRELCQLKEYSTYIWHTHPTISKGYPSAEDIVKTLKHAKIHIQFIFTTWGIWELSASKHRVPSSNTVKSIGNESNGLYHLTNRGKQITNALLPFVDIYCDTLNNNLSSYGFSIVFTPWNKIPGRKGYIVRNKI